MSPEPVPVVLCFDVEPDEIEVGSGAPPWLGFERLVERSGKWREDLRVATGRPVRFNWFLRMDPQIGEAYGSPRWVVDRYGSDLARLRVAGDFIGLHPHALRPASSPGRWIADHADADWVDHCLDVAYGTFEVAMGEPCRGQRFGDRLLSARAIRHAADLGARYDLTVEPGAGSLDTLHAGLVTTARTPEMRHAPREPYRANRDDPLRAADERDATGAADAADAAGRDQGPAGPTASPLWMIPLTSIDPDPMLPTWRRVARRVRHPGGPFHRPTSLAADWPATPFWPMVERRLAAMSRPYLAFAIRSDAPLITHQIEPIEAKLAALLTSPLAERLVFTSPDTLVGDRPAPGPAKR